MIYSSSLAPASRRGVSTGRVVAILVVLAAAAVAAFFLWNSGRTPTSGGPTTTPSRLESIKVNILTWPGYGPLYLGKEKGFFEQEGIELDVQIQENTQARNAALISGDVDLVGITFESVVLANGSQIPMQVIGITDISDGGDGIIGAAGINSVAELKGKRVAFPEGQPSHLFLLYHLRKAGLKPTDVRPVLTDNAGQAGELFAAGQVDGAVTWEPWLSTAVEAGKGKVLVNSKGSKDMLVGIFAANRARVAARSDAFSRFLRGWYRSLQFVQSNPDEANPIMAKAFGMPPEEFAAVLSGLRFVGREEAGRLLGVSGEPEFNAVARMNEDLWREAGVMKGPPLNVADTFTATPLKNAE